MPEPALPTPLSGSARSIERAVARWLDESDASDAVVVRTSGSTGDPKDVLLSSRALQWSATASLQRLGGAGSWVLALPAHYVAGLQVIVRSVLAGVSPVVLAEHADLPAAASRLPAGGRRYLAAVPTQLYRWMSAPADVEALRSLDAVLVGGAAADGQLLARAHSAAIKVVTTYGMSETCGGCVYDGVALDGVDVALAESGAIRLRGPMLFDGYAGEPELTASTLHDGWLQTADLGRFDAAGRLEVLGRQDDVVQSGGVSISLTAVERRVASMEAVAQCAVIAETDPEWGARLVAYVVPRDHHRVPDLASTRDSVAEVLPRSWAPQEVVVLPRLPMLESGKIDRRSLRLRRATSSAS